MAGEFDDTLRFVGGEEQEFGKMRLRRFKLRAERGDLGRDGEVGERGAEKINLPIAQHAHQRPVHLQDGAVAVNQQPIGRGIRQTARPLPVRFRRSGLAGLRRTGAENNAKRGRNRHQDELQPVDPVQGKQDGAEHGGIVGRNGLIWR